MDFGKIISDSTVSLARNLITIVSSFLLISIITQYVGEAEYGIWVTVLTVVSIFTAIGGGHMHGTLIRYTPEEEIRGQTLSDTGVLLIITGAFSIIAFIVFSSFADILPFQQISINRWTSIAAISLLIISMILSKFLRNYPRSRGSVKKYELIEISFEGGYLILIPSVFLITREILLAILSLSLLNLLLFIILLVNYYPDWLQSPNIGNFWRNIKYAIPMIPKQLSSRLFGQADRYLILLFISPTAVAIYTVVDQFVNIFRIITGILNPTLYPSVTAAWEADEHTEIKKLYHSVLRGYTILCIPTLAGLSILAPNLLELVATPTIAAEGSHLILLLGCGYLIWGAENPIAYILSASEQTDKIAAITVITAIGNIILNILLLPIIGLLGAVVATVSMQLLKTIYMFLAARRTIRFSLPLFTVGRTIIATTIMSGVLLTIPKSDGYIPILLYPIAGITIYTTSLILLGELTITEIKSTFIYIYYYNM